MSKEILPESLIEDVATERFEKPPISGGNWHVPSAFKDGAMWAAEKYEKECEKIGGQLSRARVFVADQIKDKEFQLKYRDEIGDIGGIDVYKEWLKVLKKINSLIQDHK